MRLCLLVNLTLELNCEAHSFTIKLELYNFYSGAGEKIISHFIEELDVRYYVSDATPCFTSKLAQKKNTPYNTMVGASDTHM